MRHAAPIAAVLALVAPAHANAAEPPRVASYVDRFSSPLPGTSTARYAEIDFVNPTDRDGKPRALTHAHVVFAPGTVVNTRALPECEATDAEIVASGPAACPAGSIVGRGLSNFDTGFPGDARHIISDLTFVNARNQLVFVAKPRAGGPYVVLRGRYSRGNVLDVDAPPLPGTPPDGAGDDHEVLDLKEHSTVRGGRRIAYIRTPPTCPASGRWTNTVTYTFRDGVKQTFRAHTPCRRRARTAPLPPLRIRMRGLPRRRCVSRPFAVRAAATRRARQVTVYLDGRRIAKVRGRRVRARVRVRALRPGRHRLKAIARDRRGRAVVARAKFRRC